MSVQAQSSHCHSNVYRFGLEWFLAPFTKKHLVTEAEKAGAWNWQGHLL
jgi:hypothetical protein